MNATRSAIAPWTDASSQQRLRELESVHRESGSVEVADAIHAAVLAHHHRMNSEGLTLYAGTNVLSPAVRDAHDSTLSVRPALGWPGGKLQTGVEEIEEIEVIAATQVARALHARFAETRFVTATMANLGLYSAFTAPGDTIAVLSPEAGGHASHHTHATAGVRGLRALHLPYRPETFDIDTAVLEDFLTTHRPKLILVGGSVSLFPYDLAALRAAADDCGALLAYDASHTAGLIAAGYFQDPLAEGAHVVTFSTYKTLAGPAGGAIATNDPDLAQCISHAAYPVLSSNYDPARLGPLAIAAAEAVEQRPPWAALTILAAQTLGTSLASHGLTVLGLDRGCTRSHQVVVDVSEFGEASAAAARLADHGILTGTCRLPRQQPGTPAQGLRLGTQEIVRRGARLDDVPHIAKLVHDALTTDDRADPDRAVALRTAFGPDIWTAGA